eukprot:258449-Rhodomonas_salina.1
MLRDSDRACCPDRPTVTTRTCPLPASLTPGPSLRLSEPERRPCHPLARVSASSESAREGHGAAT